MPGKNTWGLLAVGALLLAALVWAFAPRPQEVEMARVIEGPFEEDGRTQVRERYTVSAPLAARLQRIRLHVGDPVATGEVLAWLEPMAPMLQDERSARENQANVAAAGAGVERATARVERAAIALQENWLELQRQGRLEAQGFVAPARLDALRLAVSGASRELDVAAAERDVAMFEQDRARAAASPATPEKQADKPLQINPRGSRAWAVRAPVAGVVLKVSQSSDNVVAPGQALLDIGDPASLERLALELAGQDKFQLVIDATGALTLNGRSPEKRLDELDAQALIEAMSVNAIGPALLLKQLLSRLASGERVIWAKLSARVGSIEDNRKGGWYGYRASKAALNMLLQTAAIEIARRRPLAVVAALQPGTVRSGLSQPFVGEQAQDPLESAARLLRVLDALQPTGRAQFVDHAGQSIPW